MKNTNDTAHESAKQIMKGANIMWLRPELKYLCVVSVFILCLIFSLVIETSSCRIVTYYL